MPTDEHRNLHRETLHNATKYADFTEALRTAATYLTTDDNATRLLVAVDQVTDLGTENVVWIDIWAKYSNPNTRTRAVIVDIETDFQRINAKLSTLQQQVKTNAATKTGEDHLALGIHIDKPTRTPVPRQTVAPNVEEYQIAHLQNKFRTSYPDSAGDFHRRLPAYNSLLIKVAYPAAGVAPVDGDFDHISVSGRGNFTVMSPPDTPKGTIGYVKVCYVNSRGEIGPESEPLSFVVN